MSDGIVQSSAQTIQTADLRIFGIAVAKVVSNNDKTGLARVKVNLPWLPGLDLWARVAMPMAGPGRGMFFIPQQDDEVLVAFNRGDVQELYVIGSLWNGQDKPPSASPDDSKNKRIIHTPAGHVIT